jgi:uncharacterized protein YegP (UPF0339 family)
MYFEIRKTTKNYPQAYWWVIKSDNHQVLAMSEMYLQKISCVNAINIVKGSANNAVVYDFA